MQRRWMVLGLLTAVAVAVGLWWWAAQAPGDAGSEASPASEATTPGASPAAAVARTIAGRVVDSTGAPIAGATVDTAEGTTATTDASGAFALEGLAAGQHRLDARAPGFAAAGPQAARRVEVVLSDEEPGRGVSGLELVLRRPAGVSGRVTAAGRPLDGARLGVYYLFADGLTGPLEPFVLDGVAQTSQEGGFELDGLAPGRLRLLVEAPGYALTESRELYLEPGDQRRGLTIELDPRARLTGEVVDTEGRAVAAELVLRGGGLTRSRRVRAGAQGGYAFDGLPAGTYALEATADGYRTELVEGVEVAAGEPATYDVVLEAARGIVGRVVGPDGAPVAGAFVHLERPAGLQTEQQRRWPGALRTDAQGRFAWDDPPVDTLSATAVSPHHGDSRPTQVRVGQDVTLALEPGGAVAGRVVGPDGRPVQSFGIGVESVEVDGPRPYRPAAVGVRDVHDSDGRFRFESLRPGTYWLRVQTARYADATSAPVVVRPGTDRRGVTIRVGEAGGVAGRVTDAETGQPIAGASVVVFDPTSPFAPHQTRTDAQGRYAIGGMTPGRRSLRVAKKDYLTTIAAGLEVRAGGQTARDVEIRRQKPGERMQFHGIGAVLTKDETGIRIVKTMDDHPASQFGLQGDDVIVGVDGESVEGLRLGDVIERIRGEQGVPVSLEIRRDGQGTFSVEVERGQVVVK